MRVVRDFCSADSDRCHGLYGGGECGTDIKTDLPGGHSALVLYSFDDDSSRCRRSPRREYWLAHRYGSMSRTIQRLNFKKRNPLCKDKATVRQQLFCIV